MKKIIFLDIDGVLNSLDWYISDDPLRGRGHIDPIAIKRLNDITDSTGAYIVLSSSWRHDYNNTVILLKKNGLTGKIIGKTPDLCLNNKYIIRGNEILKWLIDHKTFLELPQKSNILDYKSYVIIDDDNDILLMQSDNFVHTNYNYGLTNENVNKAIIILNNNE